MFGPSASRSSACAPFRTLRGIIIPGNHDPHQPRRALGARAPPRSAGQRSRPPRAVCRRAWPTARLSCCQRRCCDGARSPIRRCGWTGADADRHAADRACPWLDQRFRVGGAGSAKPDRPDPSGAGGACLSGPRRLAWAEADRAGAAGIRVPRGRRFRRRGRRPGPARWLPAPGAPPEVTPLAVGRFAWRRQTVQIHGLADLDVVIARLRTVHAEPTRLLLDVSLEGTLSLAGRRAPAHALDELRATLC